MGAFCLRKVTLVVVSLPAIPAHHVVEAFAAAAQWAYCQFLLFGGIAKGNRHQWLPFGRNTQQLPYLVALPRK